MTDTLVVLNSTALDSTAFLMGFVTAIIIVIALLLIHKLDPLERRKP
jgi:hypothetical protein